MDHELKRGLEDVKRLLSRPGNDFSFTRWDDRGAAVDEIDMLIEEVETGGYPHDALLLLLSPSGPLQSVAERSGWGLELSALEGRIGRAIAEHPPMSLQAGA